MTASSTSPLEPLRGALAAFGAPVVAPIRWLVAMSEAIDDAWDVTDPLLSGELPADSALSSR